MGKFPRIEYHKILNIRTVLKIEVEQQCPQSTKMYISKVFNFRLKTQRTFLLCSPIII